MTHSEEDPTTCFKNLKERITKLSKSKKWEEVTKEWELTDHSILPENNKCICGHFIEEHYHIYNIKTNNYAVVGSSCVLKFNSNIMTEAMNELNMVECEACDKKLKDKQSYIKHIKTKSHILKATCSCSKLTKNNYFCKKCLKNDNRNCKDCKIILGKNSVIPIYITRCKPCHISFKTQNEYAFITESSEDYLSESD